MILTKFSLSQFLWVISPQLVLVIISQTIGSAPKTALEFGLVALLCSGLFETRAASTHDDQTRPVLGVVRYEARQTHTHTHTQPIGNE